ncbi:MAG TPA: glycosyltransferase family 4 protein, partial [Phormidium sp.]
RPSRFIHAPTNTPICLLPASRIYRSYRLLRRGSLSLYGANETQSFKDIQDDNTVRRSLLTPIKDLAKSFGTYLATPLGLLATELKRENCQAILCQEYEYARFDTAVLLGKMVNLPVFATFQGGDRTQSWLEILPRHLSFRNCQGVIVPTKTEIQRIQSCYRIPVHKIAQIFNPLDISAWEKIDRQKARTAIDIPLDAKVVIWHGRVEIERKGLDILLAAWQNICNERSDQDLRLWLLGTGSDAEKLQQKIDSMQLKGILWLNEFISDRTVIQTHLCAADVYAFPSRQEGFPLAPIEAMACSLPVVAADAPGIPDIFAEGEVSGGIVVPRGEAIAFTSALDQLLDNQTRCRELGKRARHRAETCFSPQLIGQQLSSFLLN